MEELGAILQFAVDATEDRYCQEVVCAAVGQYGGMRAVEVTALLAEKKRKPYKIRYTPAGTLKGVG